MFTGLKVLELASVLAGPSAGQFFAELGAEVIKVENPKTGGDVTRSWKTTGEETDDRSAYFCSCNWGKKSVLLDLTNPVDSKIVKRLAVQSDIIIVSHKPGDAEKLGIGFQQIHELNPGVIYGQITGYGPTDERLGYDAVIQAESGFMYLNGAEDGPPTKMPVALIDVLAAHQLKEGLLLALWERERSGKGSCVEISLLDTAIASLANQATNWLVGRQKMSRQGSAHPNIAPYGDTFETSDHHQILVAVGNDRQFSSLLSAIELDSLAADDRFQSNINRVRNRGPLKKILGDRMAGFAADELISRFRSFKIPAGLIRSVAEVFDLPQAKRLLIGQGALRGVRNFVGAFSNATLLPPPHLGEHTREIRSRFEP